MKKKYFNFIVGFVISAFFIYISFKNVEFKKVYENIFEIKFYWLLPMVLLSTFTIFLRSYRSKYFYKPFKVTGIKKLFYLFCFGAFSNTVMPFRLGEIMRAYMSGKILKISKSACLGIIFLERIFDGMIFLVLLFFVSSFIPKVPETLKPVILISSILFFGLFIFSFIYIKNIEKISGYMIDIKINNKIFIKIRELLLKFSSGLESITEKKLFFKILFISLLAWFLEGANYYLIAKAFSMNINVFQGVFIMLMVGLGIMIPSSPGFVGTYEIACQTAIVMLGFDKTIGISFAILIHFIQIFITAVLGIISIFSLGLKISDLNYSEIENEKE